MSENTLDHDDLTETQEYFIAGIVILLFGLLYWFLNHGWNSNTQLDIAGNHLPETDISIEQKHSGLKAGALGAAAVAGSSAVIPETPSIDNKTTAADPTEDSTADSTEAETPTANMTDDAKANPATAEAVAPLSLTATEIAKLKDAEEALKNTKKVTAQADKEAKGQAAAISKLENDKPKVEVVDPANDSNYTLPDGTPVKVAADGFEGEFRDAIIEHKLYQPIAFDSIYFNSGSTKLNSKSKHQLRATAALLHKHKDTRILLRGHTDSVGGVNRNVQLSLYRANATALALGKLGIDTKRIRIIGVGAAEPIASNKTKDGRRKNRRIEVLITK